MTYLDLVSSHIEKNGGFPTDLLIQLFYVFAVLAVISLFVCTLPVWLIVLVVVLL